MALNYLKSHKLSVFGNRTVPILEFFDDDDHKSFAEAVARMNLVVSTRTIAVWRRMPWMAERFREIGSVYDPAAEGEKTAA